MDTLWLLNGVVFYVLLFTTGQWRHVVPTSWSVIPNAVSVGIQYLSLQWPVESGWVAYNSLQLIAYFVTIFTAAPLALLTGLGMSPALSTRFKPISRLFSIQVARSLHFLVLVWFLFFITVHVALVFTTGLLRNLNHIYAGRDATDWVGFAIFAASMVVVVVGWVAATPFTLRHPRVVQRVGFALIGPAQRLFEHLDATPGQYSEKDISPYFWHNGQYPDSPEYTALFDGHFADYRLLINGLVEHPVELDPDPAAGAAPPRADHPALLHPRLVGHREVGRGVDADHPRPRPTLPRGEMGGVLLAGRRPRRGHLLRRAPHRADEQPPHHARLRHERRTALLRPRRAAAAAQRDPARIQTGEVDRGHRVRRATSPRSAAGTAATTKTTSSSATGKPSSRSGQQTDKDRRI